MFICQVVTDVWGFVIGFPAEKKSVTLIWNSSEVQLISLLLQMQRPKPMLHVYVAFNGISRGHTML